MWDRSQSRAFPGDPGKHIPQATPLAGARKKPGCGVLSARESPVGIVLQASLRSGVLSARAPATQSPVGIVLQGCSRRRQRGGRVPGPATQSCRDRVAGRRSAWFLAGIVLQANDGCAGMVLQAARSRRAVLQVLRTRLRHIMLQRAKGAGSSGVAADHRLRAQCEDRVAASGQVRIGSACGACNADSHGKRVAAHVCLRGQRRAALQGSCCSSPRSPIRVAASRRIVLQLVHDFDGKRVAARHSVAKVNQIGQRCMSARILAAASCIAVFT
jgi:hypothetical protein